MWEGGWAGKGRYAIVLLCAEGNVCHQEVYLPRLESFFRTKNLDKFKAELQSCIV